MKMVKWGVLGTADIARGQTIPALQMAENAELYAIAGRDLEKAKQFQKDFGFEKAYGSYEELLADPEIQAVYVPLPNHLHCEWVIKALNAKKNVLCEKPLSVTEEKEEEMFEAADANGVLLMEGFAYLHSPFMSAVKAEIDSGAIGDIKYFESAFHISERKPTDIRLQRETCGGATYDLGCYTTSMVLWMLGKEPDKVQAVSRFTEKHIDLVTSMLMSYEGGPDVFMDCGMELSNDGGWRIDRFRIQGTRGNIVSPVEFNQPGEITYTITSDGVTETKTVTAPNNYMMEMEQFGRCITDGETPHVTRDFSLMTIRTIERILKASGYY